MRLDNLTCNQEAEDENSIEDYQILFPSNTYGDLKTMHFFTNACVLSFTPKEMSTYAF